MEIKTIGVIGAGQMENALAQRGVLIDELEIVKGP